MSKDSRNWRNRICHDCNAKVGELHQLGCDMERCPSCLGQLFSCHQHYDEVETGDIPRIPYIPSFFHCAVCNEFFPDMFHVPDVEWDKFVIPTLKRKVLCRDCYEVMKELFPLGWRIIND